MTPRSRGLVTQRDNLKSLYLHYNSAYGYKTWQAGDLPWGTSTHNVAPPFGYVVSWDHVTKYKHCISITTMLMATKKGMMMTYLEWLLPIKSNYNIIMHSSKIMWQIKIIIYTLTQCPWLSILAEWRYTMRSSLP